MKAIACIITSENTESWLVLQVWKILLKSHVYRNSTEELYVFTI